MSETDLVPLQPSGARPPLVLVAALGGSAFPYRELALRLAPDRPSFGLQAPGTAGERQPLGRVEALAAHHLETLREHFPDGAYHLCGWSFGGLVAFEMAHRLRHAGVRVAAPLLLDVWSLLARPRVAALDEADRVAWFAADLGRRLGVDLDLSDEELRAPGPGTPLARLLDRAEAHPTLAPTLIELACRYRVFRAGLAALVAYRPRRYDGRLILVRAAEGAPAGSALGWPTLAEETLEHVVPGDHDTMLRPPAVDALADRVRALLDGEPPLMAIYG